ncbi:hypothetical protein C8R44DRAFT_980615 [Mycena epipterygia]|nr:hypothetical protein C8R44DRAFT_980615 [Mycena epipterygia]
MPAKIERSPLSMLRDLFTTVALCYVITLGLLRCIELHLAFFVLAPSCAAHVDGTQESYRAYQRSLDNISRVDVLKVTTGCSLVAFAAVELCLLLARRAGIPCNAKDAECGRSTSQAVPGKQLEKPYIAP